MAESGEGVTGPLGALMQSLPSVGEEIPFAPVHVRVLDVDSPDGLSAIFAAWQPAPDPTLFFQQVRERLEGALLAELSLPAAQLGAEYRAGWDWCRLLCFGAIDDQTAGAPNLLGLQPALRSGRVWEQALTHLRAESQLVGQDIEGQDFLAFEARVARPLDTDQRAANWETALQETLVDEVWGAKPGSAWRALSALSGETGVPRLNDLRELEDRVVSRETGVIRWLSPMLFQAACDLVGVLAVEHFGREVQWAACEPDELGLAPPPLLRVKMAEGPVHIPIGMHLLRWWVMPLRKDEAPAPLADWLQDQLG